MADDRQLFFETDPQRQRLLQNKLGALLGWTKPTLTQTVGPFAPDVFDVFDVRRMKLINACVEKLESYASDQFNLIVEPGGSSGTQARDWQRFLSDEISNLSRQTPPWYAGGFGHPDHVADFVYWAKMSRFDVGELTCLTVGIEPKDFNWKQLLDLTTSNDRPRFREPLEYLVKRFEQLDRTFGLDRGGKTVLARRFIAWAERFEFEVHPGFLEPLRRFHSAGDLAEAAPAKPTQDKREVDSIAQLFTAMAIEQFGYDPRQARSPTTKEIEGLAASLGMSITDDTILKYLRIGAQFISPDWTPHKR